MRKLSSNIKRLLDREIDPAFSRRARVILENIDLKSGMRVLEIGCGRGFYLKALSLFPDEIHIIGVDNNREYLNVAKRFLQNKTIKLVFSDARKLPFLDCTFDRIICTEVLEHIKDDFQVISEMYRVLKKNGKAIITVPNKNYPFFWDPANYLLEKLFRWHLPAKIWWLAGIWADHERLYTEKELINKLEKASFTVDRLWESTHHCLPFSHFLLYGLGKNLVESGLIGENFNRFANNGKQNGFSKFARSILQFFDRANELVIKKDVKTNIRRCVNIIISISRS